LFLPALILGFAVLVLAQPRNDEASEDAVLRPDADKRIQYETKAAADALAEADVQREFNAIKEKGGRTSPDSLAETTARLVACAARLNDAAKAKGDATVARSLAAELRMTSDLLMSKKSELDATWGDLVIAHALHANAVSQLTPDQLLQLNQEGVGWGQIAAGLGLQLDEAIRGVETECKVASGVVHPDARIGLDGAIKAGASTSHLDVAELTGSVVKNRNR
jgi:hypothetical protein